ncbi:MAG: ATP-binding cassette domain-containing protein [Candidatus Methylarchaceae archaeon HK01M]|nr:ATP-binding cassette domain-containing protein [Candidatus Methylarchaceae archaeon HK01M]
MATIVAKGLTKIYDKTIVAVDHVDLEVKEGEIFGFLGPNGAGKTTTIRMLSTLIKPTEGYAYVCNYNVVKEPDEVRRCIGIVFQDPALDDQLTGKENLDFHARIYGLSKNERNKRIEEVLKLVRLEDKADEFVKNYSGGMRRRLEIARGLMHYPKALFLDEPTLGLDVQTRRAIWEYILNLNKSKGITIFLTTHYMEEAEYLSDRIAIIDQGRIIVTDTPAQLRNLVGTDVITVSCNDHQSLKTELEKKDWVDKVLIHNGALEVYVRGGEGKIAALVKIADDVDVNIESINLRRPNLEDVYLHYTGRSIREEGNANGRMKMMARRRMRS